MFSALSYLYQRCSGLFILILHDEFELLNLHLELLYLLGWGVFRLLLRFKLKNHPAVFLGGAIVSS